jgi:hypothetical protein
MFQFNTYTLQTRRPAASSFYSPVSKNSSEQEKENRRTNSEANLALDPTLTPHVVMDYHFVVLRIAREFEKQVGGLEKSPLSVLG